jgi:hypothetical protein
MESVAFFITYDIYGEAICSTGLSLDLILFHNALIPYICKPPGWLLEHLATCDTCGYGTYCEPNDAAGIHFIRH